jgi:hypothetical protein
MRLGMMNADGCGKKSLETVNFIYLPKEAGDKIVLSSKITKKNRCLEILCCVNILLIAIAYSPLRKLF